MIIVWDVVVLHPSPRGSQSNISFLPFKQTSLSPVCTKHFRRMCKLCPTKEGESGLVLLPERKGGGWDVGAEAGEREPE